MAVGAANEKGPQRSTEGLLERYGLGFVNLAIPGQVDELDGELSSHLADVRVAGVQALVFQQVFDANGEGGLGLGLRGCCAWHDATPLSLSGPFPDIDYGTLSEEGCQL